MRSFTLTQGVRACPRTPFSFSSRTFTFQSSRLAESSARQVSKPKAKPNVKQPPTTTTQGHVATEFKFMGRRGGNLTELRKKIIQGGKVILYEAGSQRAYIIGAYGIGAFAFGYAFINSSIGLQNTRIELAAWQKSLYIGICIVMSVMGTVFISRTSRLVKSIVAVNSQKGETILNVSVRSIVPFRKPYTITAAPHQILFSRQLIAGSKRFGKPRDRRVKISFFKNPGKAINFAFFRLFISIRRIFTQEDFVMMEIQGQKGAFRVGIDGYVSQDLLDIGTIS